MNNPILIEKTDGVCRTILLNRPEFSHAFSIELAELLAESLEKVAEEEAIRVVVLRGVGPVFSAGGDLKFFHQNLERSEAAFLTVSEFLNRAILAMTEMPKPVLSAVTGPAFAAGFGIALSADIVVASESAIFSPSFTQIGLSPNAATTFFLSRILGRSGAAEAFFLAKKWTAVEAHQLGMVQRVWSEAEFETQLASLVQELASRPTASLTRIKNLLRSSFEQKLPDQLELERQQIALSSRSEDFHEGVQAFIEKRPPRFRGI